MSRPARIYVISNEVLNRPGSFLKKKRVERLLADAARVVVIGSRQANTEPFLSAVRSGRARYIPNGTDIATARKLARERISHPWFEDHSMPVAVAIGRLHRQKNYERLIQAFQIANAERPMRLIVIGGGPSDYKEKLVAVAAREGVGDRVDLAGETINVYPWLAQADVFVLPSLWEGGAAMVLLEAVAAEVPVVASSQAGDTSEVLQGGRYGAIVDAEDPGSIAAGLLRQVGADAIRPGGRAKDYPLKRTLDEYAVLVNEVVHSALATS
jgi:glycosyltransferase involved in cell wall biosynthesis